MSAEKSGLGMLGRGFSGRSEGSQTIAILVLALSACWIIECAAVYPVGDFPLNDDWIYALSVRGVLETGRFALPSPSAANAMAQVYWGALFCLPFGFSYNALRLSTAVLGLAGVLATFALLVEVGAPRRWAMIGALALAVDPLYLALANSFMTDVPFLALGLISLWLYLRGCRYQSATWIVLSISVAMVDILIRQFAVVLVGAIGLSYVVHRNYSRKGLLVGLALPIAGLALHLVYAKWMELSGRTPFFPDPLGKVLTVPAGTIIKRSCKLALAALPYVGFFAAPFLISRLATGLGRLSPLSRVATVVILVFLALAMIRVDIYTAYLLPLLGNVLMTSGVGPVLVAGSGIASDLPIWLDLFWSVEIGIGAVAGVLAVGIIGYEFCGLAGRLMKRAEVNDISPSILILAVIAAYALALCVLGSIANVYDRYFLPLGPLVCVLAALSAHKVRSRAAAEVAAAFMLAGLAAFSIAATHDYLALNRLRWGATAALQADGVSPERINGGYEYDGWYANDPDYVGNPLSRWDKPKEFLIATGPIDGYREVRQLQYWNWLYQSYAQLYVLRQDHDPR